VAHGLAKPALEDALHVSGGIYPIRANLRRSSGTFRNNKTSALWNNKELMEKDGPAFSLAPKIIGSKAAQSIINQ
jgi:hypothetical protein